MQIVSRNEKNRKDKEDKEDKEDKGNSWYYGAKICVGIPLAEFIITVAALIISTALEKPIFALVGSILAGKAKKEGEMRAQKLLILGIVEVAASVCLIVFAVWLLWVGQSI